MFYNYQDYDEYDGEKWEQLERELLADIEFADIEEMEYLQDEARYLDKYYR